MPALRAGQIVDVRRAGAVSMYRVLNPSMTKYRLRANEPHFMIARPYDAATDRYGRPQMVQVIRVVRVHREHAQAGVAKCRRRVQA